MTRRQTLALMATVLLLISLAGCYTVLRHPTGSEIVESSGYASYGYRTCADCHADAAYYHPYYNYGSSHYRWNGYSGSPWWYDHDWWWYDDDYYHGDEPGDPGPPPETGVRHLWGAGGWPTKGWGFGSSTAPDDGPRTPPPPSSNQSQPSTGHKEEPPKKPDPPNQDDDDDDDGDDGGLWKERKKGF